MSANENGGRVINLDGILDLCTQQELSIEDDNDDEDFKLLKAPKLQRTSMWRKCSKGKNWNSRESESNNQWMTNTRECRRRKEDNDNDENSEEEEKGGVEETKVDSRELEAWLDWMCEDDKPSLLFYGLGSKKHELKKFEQVVRSRFLYCCSFNGYSHKIRSVLSSLIITVNPANDCTTLSVEKLIGTLHETLDRRPRRSIKANKIDGLCIIIHSLDGPSLRNYQWAIADIVKHKKIQLVASVDYLAYPLLWSTSMLSSLNFIHLHVPTLTPYSHEIKCRWKGSSTAPWIIEQGKVTAVCSEEIEIALKGLPPKSNQLFRLIAELVVRASPDRKRTADGWPKIPMTELQRCAKDSLIADDPRKLRQHIQEFIDHNLLGKSQDDYFIPCDKDTLFEVFKNFLTLEDEDDDDSDGLDENE